jgi:hypothetical protein
MSMNPVLRLATLALFALPLLWGCAAVKDTGALLDKDTATDSIDRRYPAFNRFLDRVSAQCNGYPIGDGNISTLIQSDSNMIDALSRLFEGKIGRGDFSAFLGGWYPGTDTNALAQCVFAQLAP